MAEEAKAPQKSARDTYDAVADTVGLVPSVRLKENAIQGITVVVITGIAALVGFVMNGTAGLVIGTLLGLLGSLLVSGAVLMVVGWVRAAKKLSK
jgi:predicted anti-sigma-YlaC factor YlaD